MSFLSVSIQDNRVFIYYLLTVNIGMIILITSLFVNPVICLVDYIPSQTFFLHKHRSGKGVGKGCENVSSKSYIQAAILAFDWCD